MNWLSQVNLSLHDFVLFTLVLTRMSGLVIIAPVFGSNETPPQVRALLALALAVLITPMELRAALPMPETLAGYLLIVGGELLIGFTLGLGVMIFFTGIQLAGQIIAQVSGTAVADVFNPGFDTSMPLVSQFMHLFALSVFVVLGGHRLVMTGLLETFAAIPPGGGGYAPSLTDAVTTLVAQSFSLGVRAAAPATVALLLATLVMGLISRTMPQLNILAFGFGINSLVMLATLSLSLGGVAWLFHDQIDPMLDTVLSAIHSLAG